MLDRLTQPPTRDTARVVRDLTDLVLSYPAAMADQTALIFLDARGRESSSCTYAGLDAASRCVAAIWRATRSAAMRYCWPSRIRRRLYQGSLAVCWPV